MGWTWTILGFLLGLVLVDFVARLVIPTLLQLDVWCCLDAAKHGKLQRP